jgi:DNA-binding transcriptional LysR family regulator
MELRQLEHFVAAAEERHFTRAARRANIVQSGLSASIRQLERELGTPLFVRTTRQVELTPAGKAFLTEARRVLAAAWSAREAVTAVKGQVQGVITIGVMQRWPHQINLPGLLCRFHADYPGVEIRLRQVGSPALLKEVRDGQVDIAFVVAAGELPTAGVQTSVLSREPWVLITSPQHRLSHRAHVSIPMLKHEPFVDFPRDWGTRILVDRAFAARKVERRTSFEMNSVANVLDLVAHNLGVSILPAFVVEGEGKRLRAVPIRPAWPKWEMVVATSKDRPRSAAARAFEELLYERM